MLKFFRDATFRAIRIVIAAPVDDDALGILTNKIPSNVWFLVLRYRDFIDVAAVSGLGDGHQLTFT